MSDSTSYAASEALNDAIKAVTGDLTAAPATNQIDSWIGQLDLTGPGSQGEIALELKNLKDYISTNDSANIAHTLDALGQLTTKAADEDVAEDVSRKLRQLGQALTAASTSLPK
ncbi:hypothetical protein [Hymenobacter psychrophilus]|uniref:Uncharacterized protein n=1 Tax=Hymenobacter psychrophilus TaxID=651662 RepID=A0A1H3DFG3_9BACT|nr:hypothetical protein [Hymenobacter psychrophilus]SDX64444.1 hypothetical protein SAMN04488069_102314 [Hymenobacter psychrophilus]